MEQPDSSYRTKIAPLFEQAISEVSEPLWWDYVVTMVVTGPNKMMPIGVVTVVGRGAVLGEEIVITMTVPELGIVGSIEGVRMLVANALESIRQQRAEATLQVAPPSASGLILPG